MIKFKKEEAFFSRLEEKLSQIGGSRKIATFDADGTIWLEDANDHVIEYQEEEDLRDFKELLKKEYLEDGFRYKRCLYFAEKQAGFTLQEFRSQSQKALHKRPLYVFPFIRKLMDFLKSQDFEVVIVTASSKWVVEEAVKIYNLPVSYVLGVENKVNDGKIKEEIKMPAPVKKNKGEAFLKWSGGVHPILSLGNTLTDEPLLTLSQNPVVVNSAKKESSVFLSEKKLREHAESRSWMVLERA